MRLLLPPSSRLDPSFAHGSSLLGSLFSGRWAGMITHRMDEKLGYQPAVEAPHPEGTRAQKIAWVLYDWANSGYGLVILGPAFQPYMINRLLPLLPGSDVDHGLVVAGVTMPASAVMALMTSLSMAMMAVAAPVLGAVADIKGWTK